MRPERRPAAPVLILATFAILSGCSRVTFLRPDVSRGDFRRTAEEVSIRPEGKGRASAFLLAQTAAAKLAAGDAEGARDAAARAVAADGKSPEARSLLGLSLDALGRPREAGLQHRLAAELSPARGELLNNYGTWLCANGQAAQSLEWFDRAVAAPGYPTPDAALANAGACAMRAGHRERAGRDLRRAIALSPRNPVALLALARLELESGRALEARAFVERRLAAAAADRETLELASQIEQQLGDTVAADRYVQRLRAEFPRNPSSAREGGNP